MSQVQPYLDEAVHRTRLPGLGSSGATLGAQVARRGSGLAVLVALLVLFGVAVGPGEWFTTLTLTAVARQGVILAILALGLLPAASCGVLDISFANVATLSSSLLSWLVVTQHLNSWLAVAVAVAVGGVMGLLSGVLVGRLRVSGVIATLGTLLLSLGISEMLLNGQTLYPAAHLAAPLRQLGVATVAGVPVAVAIPLVMGIALLVWIEKSGSGRRLVALGRDYQAATLLGLNGRRVRTVALLLSGCMAGIGGVVLASTLGSVNSESGTPFLLPTLAALFLSTTQIKRGYNVLGLFVSVAILSVGVEGISLAGGGQWAGYLFDCAVIVCAVVLARDVVGHVS